MWTFKTAKQRAEKRAARQAEIELKRIKAHEAQARICEAFAEIGFKFCRKTSDSQDGITTECIMVAPNGQPFNLVVNYKGGYTLSSI